MAEKEFSKLGYVLETNTEQKIIYSWDSMSVEFNLINHTYSVTSFDPMEGRESYVFLTVALHEAIDCQIRELGWI